MTKTKSQRLEARTQLLAMVRGSAVVVVPCLIVLGVAEIWLRAQAPTLFLGSLVGCAYALLNLVVLFMLLAPYFFEREKPEHVLLGALISLSVGALLMYSATWFDLRYAMGLALGVATPAATGILLVNRGAPA